MATTESWNGGRRLVSSSAWLQIPDINEAIDSVKAVIPVNSKAERDGLGVLAPGGVLPDGTTVVRVDLGGALQVFLDGVWRDPHGVPEKMWRLLEGNGNSQAVDAGVWTTVTNWIHSPGTPEPTESGIPYAAGSITIPKTGRWRFSLSIPIEETATTGRMAVMLRLSAGRNFESGGPVSPYATAQLDKVIPLTAGTTVTAQFRHTSGTQKLIHNNPSLQWWEMEYLGQA